MSSRFEGIGAYKDVRANAFGAADRRDTVTRRAALGAIASSFSHSDSIWFRDPTNNGNPSGGQLIAVMRRQDRQRCFGIALRSCHPMPIDHLPAHGTHISARWH